MLWVKYIRLNFVLWVKPAIYLLYFYLLNLSVSDMCENLLFWDLFLDLCNSNGFCCVARSRSGHDCHICLLGSSYYCVTFYYSFAISGFSWFHLLAHCYTSFLMNTYILVHIIFNFCAWFCTGVSFEQHMSSSRHWSVSHAICSSLYLMYIYIYAH